jgi:hypothetical protein
MDARKLAEIEKTINATIDRWVNQTVRDRFINRPVGMPKRSLWDKFKQGVANWFWGPKGDKQNPYRWRSRFGDELGVEESFDPSIFTLNEYMEIKGVIDSLELRLEEAEQSKEEEEFGKLRLMNLIRSAAEDLKGLLFHAVKKVMYDVSPPQNASDEPPAQNAPKDQRNTPVGDYPVAAHSKKEKKKTTSTPKKTTSTPKKTTSTPKKKTKADVPTSGGKTDDAPKKSATTSANAAKVNDKTPEVKSDPKSKSVAQSGRADGGGAMDNVPSRKSTPSENPSPEENQGTLEADNQELRGFFYTEKDEPVNFEERVAGFFSFMAKKYEDKRAQLKELYSALADERKRKRWTKEETKDKWYLMIVTSDKFLEYMSSALEISEAEAKREMIRYLSGFAS